MTLPEAGTISVETRLAALETFCEWLNRIPENADATTYLYLMPELSAIRRNLHEAIPKTKEKKGG